eukprot:g4891.t1
MSKERKGEEDLAIVKEHSEWDLLRERFENAARSGNVIDLTNDSDEGVVVEEATLAESDPVTDPSTIVGEGAETTIHWTPDENRVRTAMGEVMAKILSLRELLVRSFEDSRVTINVHSVDDINAKVRDLNRTIRSIGGEFRDALRKSIQNLGRLVHKANLLITDYNRSREEKTVIVEDEEDQIVERVVNSTVSRSLRPRQQNASSSRRSRRRQNLGLRDLKRRRKE